MVHLLNCLVEQVYYLAPADSSLSARWNAGSYDSFIPQDDLGCISRPMADRRFGRILGIGRDADSTSLPKRGPRPPAVVEAKDGEMAAIASRRQTKVFSTRWLVAGLAAIMIVAL